MNEDVAMTRGRGWARFEQVGFVVLSLLTFLPTALGGSPAPAQGDLFLECLEIRKTGLFNQATMGCFPWLREAVTEKLCEAPLAHHGLASWVGFGIGFEVYGVEMLDSLDFANRSVEAQRQYLEVLGARRQRWTARNCASRGALSVEFAELREIWQAVYEKLPRSLVGPWKACWEFLAPPEPSEAGSGGARCFVEGSYDVTGEGETVVLSVRLDPTHWIDANTRLTRDLETEGVDCGEKAWREGKKLSNTELSRLECRRRGRAAVRFRVVTSQGACQAELPELTEVDWRNRCESERDGERAEPRPGES